MGSDSLQLKRRSLWPLLVLPAAIFLMDSVHSTFTSQCVRSVCNQETSVITCNDSLILILDVTNLHMHRDRTAFQKMKRTCMAKKSCDLSKICRRKNGSWLLVHYFCVDAKLIQHNSCDGRASKIKGEYGFIQSPGYPNTMARYIPCRWRMDLSTDTFVTLSVHDVATSGTKASCDGGLTVSGSDCDGEGEYATRLLCGGDDLTTMVRCGKVDVKLSSSKGLYPLRFWLSYYVQPKLQPASLTAPIQSCSGWLYTMEDSQLPNGKVQKNITGVTTTISPLRDDQNDTQIFIILLFIFCGITIVLLVILIIVCIRCRQIRLSVSDHVYSEPSPGLQAHYDYISSLDDEKPRPKLADEYFEVADALPADQRGNLPSSPAYAEVEQFAQLKKGQWSSLGSSDWSESQTAQNATDSPERSQLSDDASSQKLMEGTCRGGKMNKIISEKFSKETKSKAMSERLRENDSGPQVFFVNLKSSPGSNEQKDNKSKEEENDDHDDSSTYEQIDVYSNKNNNISHTEAVKSGSRLIGMFPKGKDNDRLKNDKYISKEKREVPTNSSKVTKDFTNTSSRVHQIREGLLSKNNITSTNKDSGLQIEKDRPTNSKVPHFQEKKSLRCNKELEVLAAKNRSCQATGEYENMKKAGVNKQKSPAKAAFLKDGPRAQGIVKNGIQKFEHNTAL